MYIRTSVLVSLQHVSNTQHGLLTNNSTKEGFHVPCLEGSGAGLGTLYSEVQCIMINGYMRPVNRMTDTWGKRYFAKTALAVRN